MIGSHSSVARHLGCFQLVAVVTLASVVVCTGVCWHAFLDGHLAVALQGHVVTVIFGGTGHCLTERRLLHVLTSLSEVHQHFSLLFELHSPLDVPCVSSHL